MKKLFFITAFALLSTNVAMAAQNEVDAYLNVSGNVNTQLAIDIHNFEDCSGGPNTCSASLGNLANPFDGNVASVGVLANKAYRIKQSSSNGALKGQIGTSSANGSINYEVGLGFGTPAPISTIPSEIFSDPQGGFKCSLIMGCPGTASDRLQVRVKHNGDNTLPAGMYFDQVKFTIEDASSL